MLLTIHNLPASTRYTDIKTLLQSKCGLQHVILDNLTAEGMGKKVTVGVAEDADAAILVRKINGLYWNEQQLYVEDVRQQKSASEQPFRSANSQIKESSDQFFRSMNLQQHSSFNPKAMEMSTMAPAVQPLMTAMYYMPDYTNQNHMQSAGNMQSENYMQSQNYEQNPQKIQSAYIGISGYAQTSQQIPQGEMMSQFNKNRDFDSQADQGPGWNNPYQKENFAGERPLFGRRSPIKNEGNWLPNQQRRQEPAPLERNNREQAWAPRDSDNRGARPTQSDFRSDFRPDDRSGIKKPRPDFRSERTALLQNPRPDFGANEKQNPFSGRQNEFSRRPNEFSGRPNEFSGRPNEFSGRPNEFSGRPNEFSGRPNQRQGRSIEREAFERPSEFSGRSKDRHGPNEFSGRPNQFSGRPNQFSGRPNQFSGRPNQVSGRPTQFSGKPNEFSGRPNDFSVKPKDPQRPDERQGRSNQYQGRTNEFTERNGRQNRPEFSRANDRAEFNRSNERDGFVQSRERSEHSRPKESSGPNFPDTRKRKLDERFGENKIHQERESRARTRPQKKQKKHKSNIQEPTSEEEKAKLTKRILMGGIRKIMFDMCVNLNVKHADIAGTNFKAIIQERVVNLLGGRNMVKHNECFELYRSMYPPSEDKATYDMAMANIEQLKANEVVGVVPEAPVAPQAAAVLDIPKLTPNNPTKAEVKVQRKMTEAKQLLSQGKVPKFPLGDKANVAQQKREEKQGYIPDVDYAYKSAIDEEVAKISDLFIQNLNNPTDQNQKIAFCAIDKKELTDDIKTNLTQNLSRRVSGSGLKVLRVYGHPCLPKRELLEKFLLRFGVLSLRKSDKAKMYTAAVDTYENYDRLCAKDDVPLPDGNTISFKPFHLTLKPTVDFELFKVIRKKIVQDMIDRSELNLLDKNWPAKEAELKKKQAIIEAEEAKRAEEEKQAALDAEEAKRAEEEKQAALDAAEDVNREEKERKETLEQENQDVTEDLETKEENKGNANVVALTDVNDTDNTNENLNDDFHVIDEVNETDSDVEFTGVPPEIVNVDDEPDGIEDIEADDVENAVGVTYDDNVLESEGKDDGEALSTGLNIDNIDVNDDDLEDY